MLKFQQFLKESAPALDEISKKIDAATKAGEIMKQDYERLKYDGNHAIDQESEIIAKEHIWGKGNDIYNLGDEALGDLPKVSSMLEVLALKNKLTKVRLKDHKFYKDTKAFYDKYAPMCEKFKALKGMVVTVTQKRAEAKVEKAAEKQQKHGDSKSLIKTLTGHLQDYLDRAAELAGEGYDYQMSILQKHGWDLDLAAPQPSYSKMNKADYQSALQKRHRLHTMTDAKKGAKTNIRVKSAAKRAAHVAKYVEESKASYMSWVDKMVDKIGKPVKSSKMVGKPWVGNVLTVVCQDGETQTWNTKMILNQSKYQTLFNQFPSRRVK